MKHKIFLLIIALSVLMSTNDLLAQFNGEKAFAYLKEQVNFGPRNPGSTGHQKCLEYLINHFKNQADKIEVQNFIHHDKLLKKKLPLSNLIASFNPQKKERIFFAAHWDTRPRADRDIKENQNKPILGANDGASGVAVLMEVAVQLKKEKTSIGVDLILFDGEDYGPEGNLDEYFLGSRYFAENYKNYDPKYGILIDMIGDANLRLPKERISVTNLPQVVNKVWMVARSMGYYEFEDEIGIAVSDDHVILMSHGIPCIDIIDFEYPDKTHRYWHTLEDTPDKCSSKSLEIVGNVLLEIIVMEN